MYAACQRICLNYPLQTLSILQILRIPYSKFCPNFSLLQYPYFFCTNQQHHADEETHILLAKLALLLKGIFVYQPDTYAALSKLLNMKEVLLDGILSKKSAFTREIFQQLTFFLAANIVPKSHPAPMFDLLFYMLNVKAFIAESECFELCEVLILLLEMYKEAISSKENIFATINTKEKLAEFWYRLKLYPSKETLRSTEPDSTLLSILKVTERLATLPDISKDLSAAHRKSVIEEVFFNCLFPLKNSIDSLHSYKCKFPTTREAGFKLLNTFADLHGDCILYLLNECILPLKSQIGEQLNWGYEPEKHERSLSGFVGIKNLGSICYMNAMLQQFFILQPFRNAILSVDDKKLALYNKEGIDDNMLHQLQNVFGYLLHSYRRDVNPVNFCFAFKESDGAPTNTSIQHDAHEFLNILFERLERILKDTPYNLLLQNIFGGKSCSQVVCSNCGNVSNTFEDYYTLSLEIKNQKNIHAALERFIASNTVSGYLCQECKKKCDASKRTLLSTLPNVLIVHLQRFSYNFDLLMNEKIHSQFEFPTVLDMLNYTEEGVEQAEENVQNAKIKKVKASKKNLAEEENAMVKTDEKLLKEISEPVVARKKEKKKLKSKEYYTYKLVGVVVHNGNAEAGHYYSYINVDRDKKETDPNYLETNKDRWVEFNDSYITEFSFSRLGPECFGGKEEDAGIEEMGVVSGRSKSAYMLIYEKMMKLPIPQKADDMIMVKEGEDILVDSMDLEDNPAVIKAVSEGKRVIYRAGSRCYILHDFHKVPFAMPESILSEVNKDNVKYLFERLVYNKEFARFACASFAQACNWLNSSVSITQKAEIVPLLYRFYTDFFIEVIPYAKLSGLTCLVPAGEVMGKFFSTQSAASHEFIQRLVKDPVKTMEILVKCPEQMVRQYIGKAALAAFLKIYSEEQEEFDTDKHLLTKDFVDMCTKLIGYELATQWTKFKQFFEMFRDMIRLSGEKLVLYAFEKDLVVIALDFFLGSQSPIVHPPSFKRYEMGNPAQDPDFSALIELITFLSGYVVIQEEKHRESKVIELKPEDNAAKCLLSTEVIQKHINCNGKPGQISKMVTHLCYQNKGYSKRVCSLVLAHMNEQDLHKGAKFMGLLPDILAVEDVYQALRIEWILGYPQLLYRQQYGLAYNYDITDEVNTFISSIGKHRKDDPLLQLLWRHRRRVEAFTAQGIKMLFQLMLTNNTIKDYLKEIPAPAYTHKSYIDWMNHYINMHGMDNERPVGMDKTEKELVIQQAKVLLDQFVKKEQEVVVYKYMIGKVVNTRVLKEWSDKAVKLEVIEVETEVYPSYPTGDKNLGVDAELLTKYCFQLPQSLGISSTRSMLVRVVKSRSKKHGKRCAQLLRVWQKRNPQKHQLHSSR
eukprot:TRINITY_DN20_c0_g1_i1.p1 TRINITY_DN20_c0_g1~~TRINITY_DN20_c0_g1_i1.p1  ORF type:complete len:1373 (-),score=178.95 TRINITY_DN20_c0_g1_i1:2037-6155(-)